MPEANDDQQKTSELLEYAQKLLASGCSELGVATGLEISPEYLGHALRVPELAMQVSSQIDQACRAVTDPEKMAIAHMALTSIIFSTVKLRGALALIAAEQSQHTKAISAYNDNL